MIGVPERVLSATETGLEFEELFYSEYARLAAALQLMTGSRVEAEDLAQEALSRVFERWERVRVMDSPVGYLYRTALNLSRKRLRRLARTARDVTQQPQQPTDPSVTAERRAAIRDALVSLSPDQRAAVILVDVLEFQPAEAGPILGITAESVRSRLYRARRVLQERFGGNDE